MSNAKTGISASIRRNTAGLMRGFVVLCTSTLIAWTSVGVAQFRDSTRGNVVDKVSAGDSSKHPIVLFSPKSLCVQLFASEVGWAIPMTWANSDNGVTKYRNGPSFRSIVWGVIAELSPAIVTHLTLSALNWQTGSLPGGILGTLVGYIGLLAINGTSKPWIDIGITAVLGTMLLYDLPSLLWP